MTNLIPIAKVVRIAGYHIQEQGLRDFKGIESKIIKLGFNKTTDDGFFITYVNNEHGNSNRNTLLLLNSDGFVMQVILGIVQPE